MLKSAELTGLEPATTAVTGRCSNQLSYNSSNRDEIYTWLMNGAQVFYECQRCGNCCRFPGFVHLTPADLDRLAAFLGLSPEETAARHTELSPTRAGLVLKSRENGECIFLEGVNHCSIQAAKPDQCSGFPNRWNFPGWETQCEAIPVPLPADG